MPAVSSVLVVGAGTAGAATAIFLAREGIAVDLVEIQPEAMALGSGITLHGNALRVLKQLVRRGWADLSPLRRNALAEDVAGPIAFLAGDAARFVTGAQLPADGGVVMP